MSMDAGESSVVQPAVKLMIMEPAQQMTMTATSEHDCCANVLSTVCDDTAELLVQLFEHSFIAALYVAVALLSIFCVAKKISYPVRHQRRFYPPPVYLLNCVFRH
ncbi:hypothetical protein [Sinobacterium caligoides]|nr:hypothetical protein [Sinobacterium caligoides]